MEGDMKLGAPSGKAEKGKVSGGFSAAKRASGSSRALSGKPKVFETKKEKKRRLILSDSDEEKASPRHKAGKASVGPKEKMDDSLEGRGELGINEKRTADAGVDKKRRKTDSLRVKGDSETSGRRIKGETSKHSEEKIDVFDPYAYRDDDEIDRKIIMSAGRETQKNFIGPSRCRDDSDINLSKIKRESLKRKGGKTDVSDSFVNSDDDGTDVKRVMDGGTLKKSKSTDSFRSKAGADIDRKNMKMESGKGKEENSDIKGCWDLGTRLVGPTSRQKEGGMQCSRSRMVDKKTPSSLHRNSGLAFQRKRKTDVFDKKRFQLEKDDDVQVIGVAQEKFDADATIGVQDKSGISKLRSNNKMKVDKCEKRGKKTDEECMKNFGSATIRRKAVPRHSLSEEKKSPGKTNSATVMVKNLTKERKVLSSDRNKVDEIKQGSSDITLKVRLKNKDAFSIKPVDTSMQLRRSVMESPNTSEQKEKGQKRGRAKEKQLLREQIKDMLVNAGWKIDCRQRMSRNYKDFVYIAPAGREYWSIVNAYNAFQKQLNSEGEDGTDVQKLNGRKSLFPVIPAEVLSILKRKTREKTEKQKKKLKSGKVSENAKIATKKKFAKNRCPKETAAGRKKKDKPDSCVVQEGKSLKGRVKQNGLSGLDMKGLVRNLKARNLANKPGYRNRQISLKKQGNSADSVDKETLESVSSEKPFCTSDARFPLGVKQKRQRGCSLLARRSVEGADVDADDFVSYAGKRSVLSWLIDSGTVPEDGKVQYMNKRRSRAMLKGLITRDGIHCYCCSKILTVSKFEIHAGSKLCQPFQNIFVESGVSLLQCQLDAWNKQEESERRGFHFIDPNGDDPNDDTCGICGDGGDLICCDGCPSTYHLRCLNIQMLPPGDWHCPNCSCRFCGAVCCSPQGVSSLLLSCSQCGEKYHQECIEEADVVSVEPNSLSMPFCGHNCEKLFKHLQELLGVKNELEAGFSWTLLQRFDEGSDTSLHELPQRAECNSNLAVALAVMDECFFPIIDRRSGFNLIHNVLYNCGSNFNRLNYSAFYTIVLERGDEIISAASIRIHGTRLAEMPFIGTRHMYRRQGMCRRLLNALESALCSLHVEKLIIPAISELMHTWTKVFDFKPLEESHRQEIRSMNLMVFPGTDMLQKPLLKHVSKEGNANTSADVVAVEFKNNPHDASEVANEASSGGPVIHSCDELEDRVATAGSGLHACHDSRATSDSPTESNLQADGAVCYVSKPQDKSESSPEIAFPCHTHGENQSLLISPNEPTFHASGDGTVHDTYGGRVDVAAKPNDHISGGGSWHSTAEVATQSADAACGYTLQASGERALYHDSDSYTQTLDAATTCKFSASGEIIAQDEPEFVGEAIECSSTSALSLPCDTAHHDVVDAAQPDLSSSDSAMQATVKVNDEFLAIERKSHNLDSYSVHCVSKGVSESLKTASESNCVSNVDDKSSELLGKSLSSSSDMSPLSDADVVHHNSHQGVKESLVVFAAESSHHKGTVPDTDKIGVGIASVELNKHTFGSSLFGTSEITTEPLEAISEPKVQISGNGNVRCNSKSSYKSPEVASVAVQNGSPVTNGSTATLVDQGLHTSSEGTPAVQKGHCNSESLYNPSSSSSVDRHSSGGANVCDISDMEIRSEQASCVVPVHASAEHVVNDNDLEALPSITLEGSI